MFPLSLLAAMGPYWHFDLVSPEVIRCSGIFASTGYACIFKGLLSLCGSPSLHLTVSSLGLRGCTWLPSTTPFIPGCMRKSLSFLNDPGGWLESQIVACDSGWPFQYNRIQHSGFHLLSGKVLLTQNAKLPLWPQNRGMGRFLLPPSLQPWAPALFLRTIAWARSADWAPRVRQWH